MKPEIRAIEAACKDIAWEYAAMLASAFEMAKPPEGPVNHLAQETLLLHVRNLGFFFRARVSDFVEALQRQGVPPAPFERPDRDDDVYAVDLCCKVTWDPAPFQAGTRLMTAINKTAAHISYSRPTIAVPFEGHLHAHGTITLMQCTWERFIESLDPLHPEYLDEINRWLAKHTTLDDKFGLRVPLSNFEEEFETRIRHCGWQLNHTPDGPV